MRTCKKCGQPMEQGFVFGDGECYYCSEKCMYQDVTEQEYEEAYENGEAYWTTWDEDENEAERVFLIERDYKGFFERFALTRKQFIEEFGFEPKECDTETIKPLVHIWYCETAVESGMWNIFFTDMSYGLSDSDLESNNMAYIRLDLMPDGELKDAIRKTANIELMEVNKNE